MIITIKQEGNTTFGTKIFAGDTELQGISDVVVSFPFEDFVTAKVDLLTVIDGPINAQATFRIIHPTTGELTEVESIRFKDGSEFDFTTIDVTCIGDTLRRKAKR